MLKKISVLLVVCVVSGLFEEVNGKDQLSVTEIIKLGRKFVKKWKFDPNHLGLDPFEHVKRTGYPIEKHEVITSDGYVLALHRIPRGLTEDLNKKPPILLQPGLLCTAGCYLDVGPERALAFILADLGFDVWIGNARGSTFSRHHKELSPSKKAFWDFSWHEIGTKDLPAVIDYILHTTNESKLSYIGHSQGTTAFFVMLSELPEYNSKVNVMFALAPVAFMENLDPESNTYQLAHKFSLIKAYLKLNRVYEILPHYEPFSNQTAETCYGRSRVECEELVDALIGYNPEMFDVNDLPVITSHFPGGASVKQFEHFAQLIKYGGFRKFDFGKKKNKQVYGQEVAPEYNLGNIKIPVFLFFGERDTMSTGKDVFTLGKALVNAKVFRVPYSKFNHADFLWGINVFELLYQHIFQLLIDHNENYFD